MGNMVTSRHIGLRIKALRQQAGLSQEKLAEMVGVTFQQVQKYENGLLPCSPVYIVHQLQDTLPQLSALYPPKSL